jgi:hypothetical protein
MSSENDNDVPASNDSTGTDDLTSNDDSVKRANIGDLGDIAHPFDQTNGIVDGLDGNADDAETFNERDSDDSFVAGAPGVGGVAGAGVVGTDRDHVENDPDA